MVFVAGIDEAGYGPRLGPLVLGYSWFRLPQAELDLWQALEEVVARKPGRHDRRLQVNDSKIVNSGVRGRDRLERSVAAFHRLLQPQADLRQWILQAPSGSSSWFQKAPWLADWLAVSGKEKSPPIPLCPSPDSDRVELDHHLLKRCVEKAGIQLVGFGVRVVSAGEWNHLVQTCGGKGAALFQVTMEVVRHLLQRSGDAGLRLELDRHGARRSYGPLLKNALQPNQLEVHQERVGGSTYTLHFEDREVQIRFQEGADLRYFPVSLASMAAKLTRERVMDFFNAYFCKHMPDLKPTKGYAMDAKRWLADVGDRLPQWGVSPQTLIRNL
ncbi:MAG: hypothetical protein DWQ01_16060 [Planctomycetota bacterium]|nr:MAG: hypothetical protein DWQ01_16060 [Planctomycetota bacterium]